MMDGKNNGTDEKQPVAKRREFPTLLREGLAFFKHLFSLKGLWALFPVLIAVAVVCAGQLAGNETKYWKGSNETAAIFIMSATVAIFLLRTILFRQPYDYLLLALSIAFLCREIHFQGTSKGVYVAVAIIGVWAWIWRDSILDAMEGKITLKTAVAGMIWSYFISIIIQRRVFKHIPLGDGFHNFEHSVHVALEEVTENASHLMFFAVGLLGGWKFGDASENEDERS